MGTAEKTNSKREDHQLQEVGFRDSTVERVIRGIADVIQICHASRTLEATINVGSIEFDSVNEQGESAGERTQQEEDGSEEMF